MHYKVLTSPLVVLGALTGFSNAFWRMSCTVIQTGRIDPIQYPSGVADHVHKIAGASNFNLNSTYATLQTSNCTSCEIQADKSAYWTPSLYYQHPNGTFQEVPANGMTVYYLGRGTNRSHIQPFPPGFRMLSGDQNARTFDNQTLTSPTGGRPVAERVSFACLDKAPQKETPHLAQTSCENGLRAQIHFQSCWDGVNLYMPDQSHVAYLSGIDNGECPHSHPVPFVHLFFEVLYGVAQIHLTGGKYVFSQGDTTGFGFHGDFMNGWDAKVLTEAVAKCANTVDGNVGNCDAFKPTHVMDTEKICPPQKPLSNEPVRGFIENLPGNHTIGAVPAFVGKAASESDGVASMTAVDGGMSSRKAMAPTTAASMRGR